MSLDLVTSNIYPRNKTKSLFVHTDERNKQAKFLFRTRNDIK